jgi:hypothetical protein
MRRCRTISPYGRSSASKQDLTFNGKLAAGGVRSGTISLAFASTEAVWQHSLRHYDLQIKFHHDHFITEKRFQHG